MYDLLFAIVFAVNVFVLTSSAFATALPTEDRVEHEKQCMSRIPKRQDSLQVEPRLKDRNATVRQGSGLPIAIER